MCSYPFPNNSLPHRQGTVFSSERERLEKAGWEKRFVTDATRVGEMEELFMEMGFEVMAVPYESSESGGCDVCVTGNPDGFRVIYTRKKKE